MARRRRDELEVGVSHLDAQHRRLVELLVGMQAALIEKQPAKELRRLAAALTLHARIHFSDEEMIMEGAAYPGLAKHREMHREFTDGILRLQTKLRFRRTEQFAELLNFEREWIARHLDEQDGQFSLWLQENAVEEDLGRIGEVTGNSSIPITALA
jgi:hemerythrin